VNNKTASAVTGICASLAVACAASHAGESPTMPATHTLHYVHLYSDASGVSHFRDEELTLRPQGAGVGDSRALSAPDALISHQLSDAPGATLLLLKRGAVEDWHRAPRRMYLVVVQGMAEVTASDGEVRRFGLGSIILMDDTTGKGHITRALGSVDHIALAIPAPAR
jgi:hypothetical protein